MNRVILILFIFGFYQTAFAQSRVSVEVGLRSDRHTSIYTELPDSMYMISGRYIEPREYIGLGYDKDYPDKKWGYNINVFYTNLYLTYLAGRKWKNFTLRAPEFTSNSGGIYVKNKSVYLNAGVHRSFLRNRFILSLEVGPAFHFHDMDIPYTASIPQNNELYTQLEKTHKKLTWNGSAGLSTRILKWLTLETTYMASLTRVTKPLHFMDEKFSQRVYWENWNVGLKFSFKLPQKEE
ncbi:MAG: hypothetical protein ABJ004_20680 [Cyclobacteriaceae bacterium]